MSRTRCAMTLAPWRHAQCSTVWPDRSALWTTLGSLSSSFTTYAHLPEAHADHMSLGTARSSGVVHQHKPISRASTQHKEPGVHVDKRAYEACSSGARQRTEVGWEVVVEPRLQPLHGRQVRHRLHNGKPRVAGDSATSRSGPSASTGTGRTGSVLRSSHGTGDSRLRHEHAQGLAR